MKTTVIINLEVEGIHHWDKAKDLFPEVAYLSNDHRHQFYISCEKEVFHDDRDIEFIIFKRQINSFLKETYFDYFFNCLYFGNLSCESIAKILLMKFNLESCTVMEDNENGAKIIKN